MTYVPIISLKVLHHFPSIDTILTLRYHMEKSILALFSDAASDHLLSFNNIFLDCAFPNLM